MRFFSARHLLFCSRLLGLLLLGTVVESCHSAKVAYQFQPAATSTSLPPTEPTTALPRAQPARRQPSGRGAATASRVASIRSRRPLRGTRPQQLAQVVARRPLPRLSMAARPATQSGRRQPAGSRGPAEVGLGTTVLGVLSLIVLPIALIGLALSGGGLVWAALAGAAALGLLVAWLDPFW